MSHTSASLISYALASPSSFPTLDESRRLLLDTIGPAPELTIVRPIGNRGDELIWAGTRRLIDGHVYREIDYEELPSASGELAVIAGGGAWGRRFNEIMPEVLAIAELRFDRVIVFPSTFEVAEDRVRDALKDSNATVFARELESYRQISGLCRARLAHDGAFFFDYAKYASADGEGELNAFRTDDESTGLLDPPPGNEDISLTSPSLDDWLATIARHAIVNTDRAHVMIAAALMGKRVNYAPNSYFKVEAIAQSALTEYDLHRYPPAAVSPNGVGTRAGSMIGFEASFEGDQAARTTIAFVGRDESDSVGDAIASTTGSAIETRAVVYDRNSRPQTRRILDRLSASRPDIDFRFADRDSGLPATLRLAAEDARTEYVMFLGYEMRLEPDALERMIAILDSDPSAQAVAPIIVDLDGTVQHAGGWMIERRDSVHVDLGWRDSLLEDIEPSRTEVGWVPIRGSLFRSAALHAVPFAPIDDEHAQNADWCLRAAQFGPGSLRLCTDAVVTSVRPDDHATTPNFLSRCNAVRALPAQAEFLRRQGRVLSDRLALLVPELRGDDHDVDVAASELLLACVEARGSNWTLMEWMNGGLDPLFAGVLAGSPESLVRQRDRIRWLELRNEMLTGIENGSWWKLRERVGPLRRVASRMRGGSRGDSAH